MYRRAMCCKSRIAVSLPHSLKKAVEDFAAKGGVSVNQYIACAVAEKIGARGAAEFFAERGKDGMLAGLLSFSKGDQSEGRRVPRPPSCYFSLRTPLKGVFEEVLTSMRRPVEVSRFT